MSAHEYDPLGLTLEEIEIEDGVVTMTRDEDYAKIDVNRSESSSSVSYGSISEFFTVPLVESWEVHRPPHDDSDPFLIEIQNPNDNDFDESSLTESNGDMRSSTMPAVRQIGNLCGPASDKEMPSVETREKHHAIPCPTINKSTGKNCKSKSRRHVPYCSNHNFCKTCKKATREDWPFCLQCDPNGINEHGEKRPTPRKNKCRACRGDTKCTSCKPKQETDENQDPLQFAQVLGGRAVTPRCPAFSKNSGNPCKNPSRKIVDYCSVHNSCVKCGRNTTMDWQYCETCDPVGAGPFGEKRKAPRVNKCKACTAHEKCESCSRKEVN